MLHRSSSRCQRSKGSKMKTILQIAILLGIVVWLSYQVKHSYDKKNEFLDDNDDQNDHINHGGLHLGRKEKAGSVGEVSKSIKSGSNEFDIPSHSENDNGGKPAFSIEGTESHQDAADHATGEPQMTEDGHDAAAVENDHDLDAVDQISMTEDGNHKEMDNSSLDGENSQVDGTQVDESVDIAGKGGSDDKPDANESDASNFVRVNNGEAGQDAADENNHNVDAVEHVSESGDEAHKDHEIEMSVVDGESSPLDGTRDEAGHVGNSDTEEAGTSNNDQVNNGEDMDFQGGSGSTDHTRKQDAVNDADSSMLLIEQKNSVVSFPNVASETNGDATTASESSHTDIGHENGDTSGNQNGFADSHGNPISVADESNSGAGSDEQLGESFLGDQTKGAKENKQDLGASNEHLPSVESNSLVGNDQNGRELVGNLKSEDFGDNTEHLISNVVDRDETQGNVGSVQQVVTAVRDVELPAKSAN